MSTGDTNEQTPSIVEDATAIYDATRAINHATIFRPDGLPAPVVYTVLGNLKSGSGFGLEQALRQLASGLKESLEHYDVYEDDGRDPAQSVATATEALNEAAACASKIGELLSAAQNAIAGQGFRRNED